MNMNDYPIEFDPDEYYYEFEIEHYLKECWVCGELFPSSELDQDKICNLCNEKLNKTN